MSADDPNQRVSSRKIREAVEAQEAEKAALVAKEELRSSLLAGHVRGSRRIRGISPGTMSARLARRRSRVKAGARSRARNRR